jgi:hypothetical protein
MMTPLAQEVAITSRWINLSNRPQKRIDLPQVSFLKIEKDTESPASGCGAFICGRFSRRPRIMIGHFG